MPADKLLLEFFVITVALGERQLGNVVGEIDPNTPFINATFFPNKECFLKIDEGIKFCRDNGTVTHDARGNELFSIIFPATPPTVFLLTEDTLRKGPKEIFKGKLNG